MRLLPSALLLAAIATLAPWAGAQQISIGIDGLDLARSEEVRTAVLGLEAVLECRVDPGGPSLEIAIRPGNRVSLREIARVLPPDVRLAPDRVLLSGPVDVVVGGDYSIRLVPGSPLPFPLALVTLGRDPAEVAAGIEAQLADLDVVWHGPEGSD